MNFSCCLQIELLKTSIQRLIEAGFLLLKRLPYDFLAIFYFRENPSHFADQCFHQRAEERLFSGESKLAAIFDGATENATEDVVAAVVAGHDAVGDGE